MHPQPAFQDSPLTMGISSQAITTRLRLHDGGSEEMSVVYDVPRYCVQLTLHVRNILHLAELGIRNKAS